MARNFNYAAPGAKVGVQADNVVITGGIVIDDDGIRLGGRNVAGDGDVIAVQVRRIDGGCTVCGGQNGNHSTWCGHARQ
jgi:hypothetical protein